MESGGSSVTMIKERLVTVRKTVGKVIGGSYKALKRKTEEIIEIFQKSRDKVPIYVIQHDGTVRRTWDNVGSLENRAYDVEHNHKNQIFMDGYANALDVSVEDIETGGVKLKPSPMYKTYMQQKVISDSYLAGADTLETVKYLGMANLIMIVFAVIIGVSMI